MNDEAKQVQIRWRRILLGFHVLMVLIARLLVGSIDQMPPPEIYQGFEVWGLIVLAHAVALAYLDGRDHADLPFRSMTALVQPRERRWSLFVIDAALWLLFTVAIANRVIPEVTIFRYVIPLALLWLGHTGFGILHILLVIYAEVRARTPGKAKHKRGSFPDETPLLTTDDGELIDFPDMAARSRKGEQR